MGQSWPQSQGWSKEGVSPPSTTIKMGALPPPEVSTRCLEALGPALNLAPLPGEMQTLKPAGPIFPFPASALWPSVDLPHFLQPFPSSLGIFRLKTNTCMRRVRSAASSPCRRARSVRREVVCSRRALLSARCVAADSCSLRLCRRTWVERRCMCVGQGWGQAVCLRTVLGSAY